MSATGLRQQAARGVRWTLLATVTTTTAQLLQLVVLSRLLSPRDFGLMGILLIITGLALAYTDLGVSAAIVHRQDATRHQLSSLYWLNLIAGAAVFALVWLVTPLVVRFFREPALAPLLRALSLMFLIIPLGKQFEILLQRELQFDRLARIETAAAIAGAVAAVAAAAAGLGVWALVVGVLTTATVKTAQLLVAGLRDLRPALHFSREDLRGFIRFGAFQVGEQTLNYLSERLDQLLIGRLLGVTPLGFYNFAFNLSAQPISRINPVVTKVAYPTFCRVQDDVPRLRRGYLQLVRLIAVVNAPLLVGLAAVAPTLVPLVFGAKWIPSIPILQVLCFVALSRTIGNPLGSLLLARGRADLGFRLNALLFAVSIPAVIAGGLAAGALGIAVALLLLQVAAHLFAYARFIRPMLGHAGTEYFWMAAKPILLAGAMLVCIVASRQLPVPGGSVTSLLVQVGVGAGSYIGLLLLTERRALQDLRAVALGRA